LSKPDGIVAMAVKLSWSMQDPLSGHRGRVLVCTSIDNAIRWQEGERLDHLFEQRCDRSHASADGKCEAVVTDDKVYSFRELDQRANQVARFLIEQGVQAGDRVGLIFDKGVHTYIALLAVMKANAAYVPLDAGFPNERIAFILQDAGVKAIVSMSAFRAKLNEFAVRSILLDEAAREIDAKATERLAAHEKSAPVSPLAYLIYTSGTTGTPKGVAIDHASICNFVKVAAEVYGMRPGDRCYQGMTIAFDFSVEELWVPLLAGATLVPGRAGTSLVGNDLADFLLQRRVTVMACVPTLLATIERDLPDLRILLVSGEACPHNLVVRWQRPGRAMLNAYGPTEATVTATLTELYPDKPVTIGGPLPTYSIVILDENKDEAVEAGGMGEIGIAGIGLAAGYLNRDDLTQKKFIPDFLHIPNNPSGRIYRTGDLGRINDQDEVEFHGRIDTQVKVRGYRIELTEIESVLMTLPQIAQAVVDVYEFEPGATELVAYYSLKQGASELSPNEISEALRRHLPGYMVPSYLERLPVIPMTPSNKADRKNLPPPKGPRVSTGSGNVVAPRNEVEAALVRALVAVMKVEHVSVTDNFFQDLGAHSLLMARFASEIRKTLNGADVSMRDIYLNPTVEKLALHIGALPAEGASPQDAAAQTPRPPPWIATDASYVICGGLQLLYYVTYAAFAAWLLMEGFDWTLSAAGRPAQLYLRTVEFGFAAFVVLTAVPIAAKWLLIGRWTQEVIPVWTLQYFRFWLVKNLLRSAPMALFVGTPLYSLYLRLLGANIGRGTVIATKLLPVCTDLISIGDNSIIRRDAVALGYKAQSNYIYTGKISIGANAFVGEASVLDIDTVMEDGTQLGHASSLHAGQRVPKGRHYHGSPAQETSADYCMVEPRDCPAFRRAAYTAFQLIGIFAVAIPAAILLAYELVPYFYGLTGASRFNPSAPWPALLVLAAQTLALSLVLFFGVLLVGLLVVGIVPRFFSLFLQADRTYVLFGTNYLFHRIVSSVSNAPVYKLLFGDSSYVVYYLQWIGYRLNKIIQTGANFGLDERHDNPFLCDIGSGTMVSDGLTMMNVTMSSSSFKLSKVKIGDHNYLGNNIFYPAASRAGANCLLGTKVMVPVDGPVRENVGLLGSPCFEIPRVVDQDKHSAQDDRIRERQVRAKNRYNIVTMIALLIGTWLFFFSFLYSGLLTYLYFRQHEELALFLFAIGASIGAILWFAMMERGSIGFGRLRPMLVSMYDRNFWHHERHWKFCGSPLILLFKGTPLKNAISRLLGVRLGKKVFDDGCRFHDKTLVAVGDHATLNEGCVIQGHSLEEGIFKCDTVTIGNGCTIGCAAFVHYGVTIGDNVVLEPDSFLMKGEIVDANTTWLGNPAKAGRRSSVQTAAA
jgi:non-ribosomal peptide synthetase-like protein